MDYNASAKEILSAVGGKENLISAAHCATRLRLVIADNKKCNIKKLEDAPGVKGVFEASGQLQVIIGTGTVNKVYDEFVSLAQISASTKDEVKKAAASKAPWYQRAVKTLGDVFVPIIPAIVASGLLMGLLEGLSKVFPAMADSGTYTIIHLFSNAAFVFLPILIAMSAAKVFGANQFLGAVVGMIMIHPDLMNAWNVAGADHVDTAAAWFGLYNINLVGYQGHVIPVVIAVWILAFIEKRLHKIVPEIIDLFVTPLVSVLVTGYLALTVIGPAFGALETGVLNGVQLLITIPFGIGAMLCGAVYAPTVVAGVHHMYNALEAGLLSKTGFNIWMPIATAANVAQGAAALAFSLKTKSKKQRSVALPASLSAFMGITEPAIFGVNLRFSKPFIAGIVGGAAGGLVAGILHVSATAYGITGIFGLLITTHNIISYLITMAVSFVVAFFLTFVWYKDEAKETKEATENESLIIKSPLSGTAVKISEVPDETFSGEILGKGAAIKPESTTVVSPADGKVSTLFETNHAIGITSGSCEILIHIGINTVELNGEGFSAFVKEGDFVKAGQKLITFDKKLIEERGYNTITPVIITNSEDFESIELIKEGSIEKGDEFLKPGEEKTL